MASDARLKAVDSIVQGQKWGETSGTQLLNSDEVNALHQSLAQFASDTENLQHVESTTSAAHLHGGAYQARDDLTCLWTRLLETAVELQDQMQRGHAVEAFKEEMEDVDGMVSQSDAVIAKLHGHFETLDEGLASSMRLGVGRALSSAKNDDTLASELLEMLGFEQFDLIGEIVNCRRDIDPQLLMPGATGSSPLSSQPSRMPSPTKQLRAPRQYLPQSQVRVQSAQEIAENKALRAANRKIQKQKGSAMQNGDRHLTPQEMEHLRQQQLMDNASRPLYSSEAISSDGPQYPHVFASGASGNTLSVFGSKFALPAGTSRADHKEYEEVAIPPPRSIPMRATERLIPITELDAMCRGAFPGYQSLNRLQSAVYPLGYASNENLLVCAPTGAGKTDVAMLTVLRAISQFSANVHAQGGRGYGIRLHDFKIVYVAPMKALAAEVVRKFSKRLSYLGVRVRELTGDMQLTRQEIAETQMIVTTPEKWDVVTRKPTGEGELGSKVKLLIVDEVHLLHEDRGAVIETIVARTLRLVESSQSLIRIVGLSATLPNYVDVADFLRVNRYQGLFYFDSSFRPVPLEQHFLGIKGRPGSQAARGNLDKATFFKVEQLLQQGHQIMIFVHARKETVKSALTLREMCRSEGIEDLLLTGREDKENQVDSFKRDLMSSRNKELKELFESGLGIHHAGMLRSDRNLSERMFEAGITKVLCCTSTLAWGVNLPAYAVLIKGTEVYDSGLGKFTDLSILDVLQIFGRAGRPQYEDLGVGYILTPQEKLSHYVDAITSQHPIESKFDKGLIDSLNAECALGTVQSIADGITWLSYTYLFTRMRRNPLAYGMSHDEVGDDPQIGAKRLALINTATKTLVSCNMLDIEQSSGKLTLTELGRIAARYYIPWRTIEIFNEKLRPRMTEADVLHVLSLATDFEQIIPRDAEEKELKRLLERAPCEVPGGIETSPGKVSILLQAHISRDFVDDFALASDTSYVAQNSGRIIRALFEISLSHRWPGTTSALMGMSKAVAKRMWPFDHPLSQTHLNKDTLYNLQRWADDVEVATLAEMSAKDVGDLIHLNERIGGAVRSAARQFPHIEISHKVRPITSELINLTLTIQSAFEWNERVHSGVQFFYVWVQDADGTEIQQWSRVSLRSTTGKITLTFDLPVLDRSLAGITVRWIADDWMGAEGEVWIGFNDLMMPQPPSPTLPLLDLPLLTLDNVLGKLPSESRNELKRRFAAFNAVQTQVFHSIFHTTANTLLSSPTASGKSTMVYMAIWQELQRDPSAHILVLVPQHRLLLQQAAEFAKIFPMVRSKVATSKQELVMQDRSLREEVVFALPQHVFRAVLEHTSVPQRYKLFVAEDLHMLSAAYELALGRLKMQAPTSRIVATSASLYDASSLAEWLDMRELSTFSFHPKDRTIPLRLSLQTFDAQHSLALLRMMVKPAYDKARSATQNKSGPTIAFVPSRAQCLLIASDLVTRAASNLDQEAFLGVSQEEIDPYLARLTDDRLHEPVLHGIGIYHDGLHPHDRSLILQLYEAGVLKLLVAPREACWSIPARAGVIIIMSCRYVARCPTKLLVSLSDTSRTITSSAERRVADYTAADLLRMTSIAVASESTNAGGECLVLCQANQVESVQRKLREALPVESSLFDEGDAIQESVFDSDLPVNGSLLTMVLCDIASGRIGSVQDVVDVLSCSLLYRRLSQNPSYYDCRKGDSDDVDFVGLRLSAAADEIIALLKEAGLVIVSPAQMDRLPQISTACLSQPLRKHFDDSGVLSLLRMRAACSDRPALAAALSRSKLYDNKNAGRAAEDHGEDVTQCLVSIRDATPGEWLAAFQVPRADRKAKKLRQQAGGAEDASEATNNAHEDDREGLRSAAVLLASYFSPNGMTVISNVLHKAQGKAKARFEEELAEVVTAALREWQSQQEVGRGQ